jgi:putative addiction module component (TIGR02574 family)
MSTTTQEVFIQALSLPPGDRAALAQRLLSSLEKESSSEEIEAAWKEEALERCDAVDLGQLKERYAKDVFKDAYRKVT